MYMFVHLKKMLERTSRHKSLSRRTLLSS